MKLRKEDLRLVCGLTQQQTADMAGMTLSYCATIES